MAAKKDAPHDDGRTTSPRVRSGLDRIWGEVLARSPKFLRQSDVANKQTINDIAKSMDQLVEIGVQLEKSYNSDEVTKFVHELADTCINSVKLLEDIDAKLDRERKFFEQYLPDKLEQITRLENAQDAQFDKMLGRLQAIQEGRLRRETSALNREQATAVNELFAKHPDQEAAEQDSPADADNGGKEADALHREPDPAVDLDADDGRDPLVDFLEGGSES